MATVDGPPIISEWMFITTIVQFFLCSLGLTMNGFLSYVIIRNKKLQFSCCAILLLCLAIYDCIAEFFLVFLSTPLNLFQIAIPLLECFWLDCYCVFAQNCAQLMMCLISIDRLISIIFPFKYRQICIEHKWKYVAAFLSVPTIYVFYLGTLFHTYALANANKPVFCMPSDYVDPVATVITYNVMMGTNLLMLAIYCLIWALLRSKVVYKIEDSVDYRIHKSLLVLMLVTFFCWLPVPLCVTFVFPSLQHLSANSINDLQRALLQLNKAAQAMNAPILFATSSQYRRPMRREMKRLWKLIFPCLKKPHAVIVPVDNYKI